MEYIKSTVGLMRVHDAYDTPKLIKAEFYRDGDEVVIRAVSGHNLGQLKKSGTVRVSAEEFADRPYDQYNDLVEADWAFSMLGWR